MHDPVEADRVLQQIIHTSHDAEDAKRKDPNPNHRHDGGVMPALEPAKKAEEGGDDINKENGRSELP